MPLARNWRIYQFGDIWIQTDTLDQFILPPHIFTLKGKSLLSFGEKFLNNDVMSF